MVGFTQKIKSINPNSPNEAFCQSNIKPTTYSDTKMVTSVELGGYMIKMMLKICKICEVGMWFSVGQNQGLQQEPLPVSLFEHLPKVND